MAISRVLGLCLLFIAMHSSAERPLTLFAAASMTEAMQHLTQRYTEQTGQPVRTVFAASSALARQITRGAPADIYLSANQKWMDYAREQKAVVSDSIQTLAHNQLVLVAPIQSHLTQIDLEKTQLTGLLGRQRLAMADPDHVPAGSYAKAALQQLSQWSDVEPRTTRSRNVRAALALVERGEVPLGIVYLSDAKASLQVKPLATFPSDAHPTITYPIALTQHAQADAQQLLSFLTSPAARQQLAAFGFTQANHD